MAWLTGWDYRKSLLVEQANGADTGYQILVKVYAGEGADGTESVNGMTVPKIYLNNHVQTDFDDVRFTEDDGSTLLSYWLEDKSDGSWALFWVKVSGNLTDGNVTIYVYYGNDSATSLSDGEDVFLLFDHFDDASIDTSKWNVGGTGTAVEADSDLTITSGSVVGNHKYVTSDIIYAVGVAIEAKVKQNGSASRIVYEWIAMTTVVGSTGVDQTMSFRLKNSEAKFSYLSGNGSYYTLGTYTIVKDTNYHRTRTARTGTDDDLFLNSEENAGTEYPVATDRYVTMNAYSSVAGYTGQISIDWLAVRKYIQPEPVYDTIGEEEPAPVAGAKTSMSIVQMAEILEIV